MNSITPQYPDKLKSTLWLDKLIGSDFNFHVPEEQTKLRQYPDSLCVTTLSAMYLGSPWWVQHNVAQPDKVFEPIVFCRSSTKMKPQICEHQARALQWWSTPSLDPHPVFLQWLSCLFLVISPEVIFRILFALKHCLSLSLAHLWHVCPAHKGHVDLMLSPPSSSISPVVPWVQHTMELNLAWYLSKSWRFVINVWSHFFLKKGAFITQANNYTRPLHI
jgi:hypothetical protein